MLPPTGLQFVVHPLPGSQEQLFNKLRQLAEAINTGTPTSNSISLAPPPPPPPTFVAPPAPGGSTSIPTSSPPVQMEVGPSHFAFLLRDGRVCRLPFSVISDRLDLSRGGAGATAASSKSTGYNKPAKLSATAAASASAAGEKKKEREFK